LDDIQMSIRQRVKTARINHSAHRRANLPDPRPNESGMT
jgi:hypothetical protein